MSKSWLAKFPRPEESAAGAAGDLRVRHRGWLSEGAKWGWHKWGWHSNSRTFSQKFYRMADLYNFTLQLQNP